MYISITICFHQKKLFQENNKSGSFHKFGFTKFYLFFCLIKNKQAEDTEQAGGAKQAGGADLKM